MFSGFCFQEKLNQNNSKLSNFQLLSTPNLGPICFFHLYFFIIGLISETCENKHLYDKLCNRRCELIAPVLSIFRPQMPLRPSSDCKKIAQKTNKAQVVSEFDEKWQILQSITRQAILSTSIDLEILMLSQSRSITTQQHTELGSLLR